MADYIKRDAVIDRIERHVRRIEDEIYQLSDEDKIFNRALDLALEIIGNEPAADVRKNVRGRWLDDETRQMSDPRLTCSNCGSVETPLVKWRFCPRCGADMRGKNDDK